MKTTTSAVCLVLLASGVLSVSKTYLFFEVQPDILSPIKRRFASWVLFRNSDSYDLENQNFGSWSSKFHYIAVPNQKFINKNFDTITPSFSLDFVECPAVQPNKKVQIDGMKFTFKNLLFVCHEKKEFADKTVFHASTAANINTEPTFTLVIKS